jgi:ribosomal protein S18 acetylase RimI-like enzyme
MVTIEEVRTVDAELVAAFERLLPQLSSSNPPPSEQDLIAIVTSRATVLFVARDETGQIIGSLSLALFRIPTGLRAWIEDVVVDEAARGKGVGELLNKAALARAAQAGAKTVDLTSRPSREAANRLYQRMGFTLRNSNVYRYEL